MLLWSPVKCWIDRLSVISFTYCTSSPNWLCAEGHGLSSKGCLIFFSFPFLHSCSSFLFSFFVASLFLNVKYRKPVAVLSISFCLMFFSWVHLSCCSLAAGGCHRQGPPMISIQNCAMQYGGGSGDQPCNRFEYPYLSIHNHHFIVVVTNNLVLFQYLATLPLFITLRSLKTKCPTII